MQSGMLAPTSSRSNTNRASSIEDKIIEQLVRDKHSDQMRWTRAAYLNMIAGLSDTAIRGRLLAIDLSELQVDDQLR